MSNTPATRQSDLAQQMDWVKLVTSDPRSSILPETYRGKPGDVLIAVGLGASMGLSPAESLYRIAVIKGKPSAGAELIAANVRKAGHRLRVTGDETTCTATINRADFPDDDFTVTRDLAWAKRMGLAGGTNYTKQPGTMLQWRSITAVARLACPEALYGVAYTPDELYEGGHVEAAPRRAVSASDFGAQPAAAEPAEVDAVEVEELPAQMAITKRTRGQLFALFAQKGIAESEQLAGIVHIVGREMDSRSEVTEDEALRVIDVLKGRPDADQTDSEDQS